MPRPAGRSGRVRTSAMLCPALSSRASARSANAGVPAKIRRRNAGRSGRLAQLLGELRAHALLLELRQVRVKVRAYDQNGNAFTLEAQGLLAVCIQHEMDHLKGKVFVEHLSQLKQQRVRAKLAKQLRKSA